MEMNMKSLIFLSVCAGTLFISPTVSAATTSDILRFRELEYEQPRDPLLFSYEPLNEVHVTPSDQIAPAVSAIKAEIPTGSNVSEALKTLKRAGGHCHATNYGDDCLYTDIQTVDEYVDDVRWHVRLKTADNAVQDVSVQRVWTRH
jgi:hypothetical protein